MRMDSTLNVTPQGSLGDLPAATGGDADSRKEQQAPEAPEIETRGVQPPTTMLDQTEETPYTSVKVVPGRIFDGQRAGQVDIPRRVLRTRETNQQDALASARHFFALENGQNQVVTLELPGESTNYYYWEDYFRNLHPCHYYCCSYYLHCHHIYWG